MWALVCICGVGPLAVDAYLGALPDIRRDLGTGATTVQLSVTLFIVGVAAGQLALGPVSDGRGRRGLLVGSATVFTLTTLLCALATDGPSLVLLRFVEGLAAGCGVAVGRATIADVATGDEAARRLGTLAAITFLAPVIAPVLGGAVLSVATWRAIFAGLTGFGAVMIVAALTSVPETLPLHRRAAAGLRHAVLRMADLLRDWNYTQHIAILSLVTGGTFTYLGGASFVLRSVYGFTPARISAVFAVNSAAMAGMSWLLRLLVGRVTIGRLRMAGLTVAAASATVLALSAVARSGSAPAYVLVWGAWLAVSAGTGWVSPATIALALQAGRRARGTASALLGGIPFLVGALATPLTGVVGFASVTPLGLLVAVFLDAALLLLVVVRRG